MANGGFLRLWQGNLLFLWKGARMFIQRFTAPEAGNKFYVNTAGGGYNKCIKINGNSVLPNCVGYAYGRFMEEAGIHSCNMSTGNAQNWFGYADGYPRGQKPKIGAVMCWNKKPDTKYGHVAIVEEVHADGSVTASMSNYSKDGSLPYFERKTYRPPYNTASGLPFQGFIYNPFLFAVIDQGASDVEINEHKYSLFRQMPGMRAVVLSAGLNKVAPIRELDANVYVYGKVTGANYFQMRSGQADPYGTTYGCISAPLNDVWTETPNQDTTLYYDAETGVYGDCTGVHIDPEHNVFSPAVVYPAKGNYQYARMVGIDHVNTVSRYTFVIRFNDGTFAIGIALQDMTIKQIAADFFGMYSDISDIAYLDGGGSAQMGRWNGERFEYVRDTGRECPSAFAIVSEKPIELPIPSLPVPTPTPEQPEHGETGDSDNETGESEEEPMEDEKKPETGGNEPQKDESWTDPEPKTNLIAERIAALLSVKSILTLTLTAVFAYLVINQLAIPVEFAEVYKVCIYFFFGYSIGKVLR